MSSVFLLLAPVAAVLVAGIATAAALDRAFGDRFPAGRVASLDGVRGYLALGVFVHHAMLWRQYAASGVWSSPAGALRLYGHLGDSSVALFFMITGFLFGAKLVAARARPIDWTRLYVSRVLRIVPLFAVATAAALLIVAVLSGFRRQVPPAALVADVLRWARFGTDDVNGVAGSWMISAGVAWSLRYEWIFYSALPIAALAFGGRTPARWLAASVAGTALWLHWTPELRPSHFAAFGAGVLATLVTRRAPVRAALAGRAAACAVIAAVVAAVAGLDSQPREPVLLLLAPAFVVVAAGNTLFGALGARVSRVLGEISYGLYLLHGLLLFVLVRGVLGVDRAAALPAWAYWGAVVALAPILVACAFAAYRLVERPAIALAPRVHAAIVRRRAGWLGAVAPAVQGD